MKQLNVSSDTSIKIFKISVNPKLFIYIGIHIMLKISYNEKQGGIAWQIYWLLMMKKEF